MARNRCEVYRVKRFDEHCADTVRGHISASKPKDYTRMGVTIRHLPYMCGTVNYTVNNEVRKLPLKVSDIYRRLTT